MTIQAFRFAKTESKTRDGRPFFVYMRRNGDDGWRAVSQAGTPEAMSNFAPDGEMLRLAMDRCASATLAMEAFRAYAYRQYTDVVEEV